jgi:excinuclease ABC subunit C
VRGQRGWVVEKVEDVSTGDLVEQLLLQVYGDAGRDAIPREVLVPADPPDAPEIEALLAEVRGARVAVRVPQRGDKKALLETVQRNASQALALHKTRRAGDLTSRSKALQEVQDALGMPDAPLRIECYDVSNIQGQHVVASMVVFEDGLPRKSEYRRFTVRGTQGQDDVAAIHEVITRRFRRFLDESQDSPELEHLGDEAPGEGEHPGGPTTPAGIDPDTGRPRKFAYPPNLVVVDGGPPQVAAAARAMEELGIDDIALCGLAKRLEEVWLPGEDHPLVLPRTSEGLYLLQRVRDEAHRFAITHHRQRRSKAMTTSLLDEVPGLGPARQKALLRAFGSVKRLRTASVDEVASVQGIGPALAAAVVGALATQTPEPAVDVATGEIIE